MSPTLALVAVAPPASAAPPDETDAVEVYERDVFVIEGSTLRNPDATTDPSAALFNNAGVNLGLTRGECRRRRRPQRCARVASQASPVRTSD